MPESAARQRLREAREQATAEREAGEATAAGERIPDVTCPKCGDDSVSLRYCEGGLSTFTRDDRCNYGERQHFHRHCLRCGYNWRSNEMPIDMTGQRAQEEQ